jgi:hypothetical protein
MCLPLLIIPTPLSCCAHTMQYQRLLIPLPGFLPCKISISFLLHFNLSSALKSHDEMRVLPRSRKIKQLRHWVHPLHHSEMYRFIETFSSPHANLVCPPLLVVAQPQQRVGDQRSEQSHCKTFKSIPTRLSSFIEEYFSVLALIPTYHFKPHSPATILGATYPTKRDSTFHKRGPHLS